MVAEPYRQDSTDKAKVSVMYQTGIWYTGNKRFKCKKNIAASLLATDFGTVDSE